MNFCKDCRHFRDTYKEPLKPDELTHFERFLPDFACMHPDVPPDPVFGTPIRMARYLRDPGAACGPDGKLFQPKEDKP